MVFVVVLLPALLNAVRVTLNGPVLLKTCDTVFVVAVVPPDVGETVKEATGFVTAEFTVTVPVFVLVPFWFVAVNVIVKVCALVPLLINVCETYTPVTAAVPSPKFQDTLVAFAEVLLNSTVSGEFPEVILLVKLATGSTGASPGVTRGK